MRQARGDALQAARDARCQNVDIVVGAGGDGTINEIINGLAGSDIPLGVIPLGTVNVFALETGIPMDPVGACNIILEGLPRKLNLGRVNGRYFLLMGASGLMHMWFTALMSGSSGSQEGCLIS